MSVNGANSRPVSCRQPLKLWLASCWPPSFLLSFHGCGRNKSDRHHFNGLVVIGPMGVTEFRDPGRSCGAWSLSRASLFSVLWWTSGAPPWSTSLIISLGQSPERRKEWIFFKAEASKLSIPVEIQKENMTGQPPLPSSV